MSDRRSARRLALLLTVVAVVALVLAAASDLQDPPEYALRSSVVWALERATTIVLLVGAPGVVLARLYAGELPSGMTTAGLEWRANGAELADAADRLYAAVERHERQLSRLRDIIEEHDL